MKYLINQKTNDYNWESALELNCDLLLIKRLFFEKIYKRGLECFLNILTKNAQQLLN